jgi:hypothetical protein
LKELIALSMEINEKKFGALTPGFNMAQRLATLIDTFIPDDISSAQVVFFSYLLF